EVDGEGAQPVARRGHDEGDRHPLRGGHPVEARPLDRERAFHSDRRLRSPLRPAKRKYQTQKRRLESATSQRTLGSWTTWRKIPSIAPAIKSMAIAPTARSTARRPSRARLSSRPWRPGKTRQLPKTSPAAPQRQTAVSSVTPWGRTQAQNSEPK